MRRAEYCFEQIVNELLQDSLHRKQTRQVDLRYHLVHPVVVLVVIQTREIYAVRGAVLDHAVVLLRRVLLVVVVVAVLVVLHQMPVAQVLVLPDELERVGGGGNLLLVVGIED